MAAQILLTSLTPASGVMGSALDISVTIAGSGFTPDSVAQWNNQPLSTTYVSATSLMAFVPAALIANSGVGLVTVAQSPLLSNALSFVVPNPIDLCALSDVKQYIGIGLTQAGSPITADDPVLQGGITSASQYWLTRTCRASLNAIRTYTERRDGNGRDTILLKQWPVRSVSAVVVDGMTVPASTQYASGGYVINEAQTGLVIIGAGAYGNGQYPVPFAWGRLNIAVTYTAGYAGVPWDVLQAVVKHVAINYKRRSTTDLASNNLPGGGGSTTFRSWVMPEECQMVLESYRRLWP